MTGFVAIAIVAILAAVALIVVPLFRHPARTPVAGLAAALAVPAAAAILYASLTTYPWNAAPSATVTAGIPNSTEIAELRRAAEARPNEGEAWLRLAQGYMEAERYDEARDAFARATALDPQDSEAKLGGAEAAIMADPTALAGEAGQRIEEVLAAEPENPRALWYSGMAALSRGANDIARERWQRLLALSPPDQVRQLIEAQLAQLSAAAAPPGASAARPAAASGTRLAVRVSLAPALASRIRAGAPVFLIARNPDRSGPPVAVVRRASASLPATIEITDADMMLPGQSLADLAQVRLTARIANGGDAQARSGDVFGEVLWRSGATGPLEITIDSIVP